jgi:predicted nuclease with RNAse H fold
VAVWAGVDVGGRRKGFHLALIDEQRVRAGPVRKATVAEAVRWLRWRAPDLVAVDSPIEPAPDGMRSRPEERLLARSVCHIRYTPPRSALSRSRYYEWILRGLALYAALDEAGLTAIECFPTASFTRWAGPRGTATRAAWTRAALSSLGLAGVPAALSQDGRDAIAAALTARALDQGRAERLGRIVVPL